MTTGINPGESPRYLPETERLSLLAAAILLAYALARMINLPAREISAQLPGLLLVVEVNVRTFVVLLVAAMTATGANWLLRDHPRMNKRSTLEHWLLPALTAWTIGLPLFQLPIGPLWWVGFFLGGIVLMAVLVAEYVAVDPDDARHAPASISLTAVAFALFLVLAVSLRTSGPRLFLILPALSLAAGLVSLRALNLRLHGRWAFLSAGVIALLTGQMVAALHYWPIAPVPYGLALLGPAYALTSLIGGLTEGEPVRRAIVEPVVVLVLLWGAAIWIH
jgi:hypothetical protein